MIGKRIAVSAGTLLLAAITFVPTIGIVIGIGGSLDRFMKNADPVLGIPVVVVATILMYALLAIPVLGTSFLCGYLQPVSEAPWKAALLWSPYTWLLVLGIPAMLGEIGKEPWQLPIGLAVFAALWAACAGGMILKRRKHERTSEPATAPYSESAARSPQG